MTICWGMGERWTHGGPTGKVKNGKELELGWSWDPVTALACHRNQEALNKTGALKDRAFKGQD